MSRSNAGRTIELYVRSLASSDSQARIKEALSRLETLERAGVIDGYEVHVWGKGVALDSRITSTEAGAFIRDRVAAFREWTYETGRELFGFDERTTYSAVTERVHRNLTVPEMALCERRGEEIEWVAPCEEDGEIMTISDRLETLAMASDALLCYSRSHS